MSNRSINAQEIRPYKVEIFGLQDDYIGTLQSFEDSFLGQIVEPRLVVKDDGTQTFTCRIPKFYIDPKANNRTPNPRWQDAEANVLAENIRVLKVFIRTDDKPENDKVYPMIIDTITDRRDSHFAVYKYIEASGLAFAELGKQGYKLELTSFTVEDENAKAAEKAEQEEKDPVFIEPTIQYWLDKVFPWEPVKDESGNIIDAKWLTPWCYEIRMDYSHYAESREPDQVYEDAYVNGWNVQNGALVPTGTEQSRIKARYIECSNSNKYNITQDIAKAFGVFCRYEYKTDLNGKFVREWTDENNKTWTGKKVIFYNKAIKSENPYVIDYEKNLQTIERKSEGSNIYSKLYVKPIEASNMTNGYVTIADVAANPTYDEFILNFDYFKSVGAVKDWQLQKVKEYEVAIRQKNVELAQLAPVLEKAQAELNECEAKVALNDKEIQSARENKVRYETLMNGTEDIVERTISNPRRAAICKDEHKDKDGKVEYTNYYIEFNSYDAVDLDAISAYLNYPTEEPKAYKDGDELLWSQDQANFQTYKKDNPIKNEDTVPQGELKDFSYGAEPTEQLTLSDDSFYAVLDDDGFLRKLYFNMSEERKNALVKEYGEPGEDNSITWQMYLVFAYHPRNKYEARVQQYEALLKSLQGTEEEPGGTAKALKDACDAKEAEYNSYLTNQEALLTEKEKLNRQLENILGPALREGYWNPSEYKGVSEPHKEEKSVVFDDKPKEGEEKLTDKSFGIEELKEYRNYLIINDNTNKDLNKEDLSSLSITLTNLTDKEKTLTLFNGPNAGFDIIFTKLKGINDPVRTLVFNQNLDGYLPDPIPSEGVSATYNFTFNNKTEEKTTILDINNFGKVDRIQVWPRITIDKKNVQYNADTLVITRKNADGNDITLRKFYDYYYHIESGYPTYTFKITENNPFINFDDLTYNISYETSAANEMFYLDARQVAKDNSIPRYSYSLTLSNLPHDFKHIDLSQLVYINDYSLGIHAATGYVNEITYHLDEPWEDEINVQNYKTKFEDLFNTIVAQSEAMKNGQPAISNVLSNFEDGGATIKGSVIQTALANNNFYFDYSATGVEITPTDGIILTNNKPYANGVYGQVVLQGGGIFISNSIDEDGNRIWSTGITPDGINANLLTAGQINTDLIKIYAGDDVAFSWNKDGIYAYCDDGKGGYNDKSYVRFSKEGLHATQDGKDLVFLTWDGLYMRNKEGKRTFELDIDGNILMSGSLQSFDYVKGINGAGWRIDKNGDAEFRNIQVRGTIAASVFKYDETTAVGGQIWVAPTLIIDQDRQKDATFTFSTDTNRLIIKNKTPFVPSNSKERFIQAGREWAVNDLVSLNGKIVDKENLEAVYEFKNLRCRLSNSTFSSTTQIVLGTEATYASEVDVLNIIVYDKNNEPITLKDTGVPLERFKGSGSWHLIFLGTEGTQKSEKEGVLITAMAVDGPYIDVYDDGPVKERFKELLGASATEGMAIPPAARLGKLDGLADYQVIKSYFGNNTPTGYGLYSDNVYLTGTIFANAGNFGGLKIDGSGLKLEDSSLNINVGKDYAFNVMIGDEEAIKVNNTGLTVNGTINATGGTIGGLAVADIAASAGALSLVIESSGGLAYSDGVDTYTTLTAKVLKGGATITSWPNSISYYALYLQKASAGTDEFTNVNGPGDDFSLSIGNIEMDIKYKYRAMLEYKVQGDDNSKYVYSDVLSFAMAKKGDPGRYVTGVSEQYKATDKKSKPSTTDEDWINTIPTNYNAINKYLWAKITETFSDGTTGEPYVTLRSTWGDTGDAGNDAVSYEIKASALNITRTLSGSYSPTYITLAADKIEGSTRTALDVARYISGGTYGNELRITLYYLDKIGADKESIESVSGSHAGWNGATGSAKEFNFYVSKLTVGRIYTKMVVELLVGTSEQVVAMTTLPFTLSEELKELGQLVENEVVVADGKVLANSIAAGNVVAGKIAAGAITAGAISNVGTLRLFTTDESIVYPNIKDDKYWNEDKTFNSSLYDTDITTNTTRAWDNATTGLQLSKDGLLIKTEEAALKLGNGAFSVKADATSLKLSASGFGISSQSSSNNGEEGLKSIFEVNTEGGVTAATIGGDITTNNFKYGTYEVIIATEEPPDSKKTAKNRLVWIKVPAEQTSSPTSTSKIYSKYSGTTRTTSMVISTNNGNNNTAGLPYGTQKLTSSISDKLSSVSSYTISFPVIVVPKQDGYFKTEETIEVILSTENNITIGSAKKTLTELTPWTKQNIEVVINNPNADLTSGTSLTLKAKRTTSNLNDKATLYMDSYSTYTITAS